MKIKLIKFLPIVFFLGSLLVFEKPSSVAQDSVNGCGSGSMSRGILARLTPASKRQFHQACNDHDACYETPGRSREDCDRAFRPRMMRLCDDLSGLSGIRCRSAATAYSRAVTIGGPGFVPGRAYTAAQRQGVIGNHKIRNRAHRKCLNLQNGNRNGALNNSWDCTQHPEQEWRIENMGDGYVRFRNHAHGKCLNLQNAAENGVQTNVWDCTRHPDQEWKIEDVGGGFVRLRNRRWGKCLNLQHASQNAVPTNAWDCTQHPDQEWKIRRQTQDVMNWGF